MRSRGSTTAGRTHGQQALPITFGYKCAAWLDELLRHAERLCQSADRLFRAILGGGAGTYASFGERGPQVASIYARRLGLKAMVVPFRNSVDHLSEYIMVLCMLGTTCGKMAREVRILGKDEFGEVSEPSNEGGVGRGKGGGNRCAQGVREVVVKERASGGALLYV